MALTTFFASSNAFEKEFSRCCKQYPNLAMYVAWIGNPKAVIPFEYLYSMSEIKAVIGVSFCQTHPDGIQLLMDLNADLRIAKDEILYHPKVYIFSGQKKKAIFIGSSNFTYHGYYKNHEANILIEGSENEKVFKDVEADVKKWNDSNYSFKPNDNWLVKYGERYKKRRDKIKEADLDDEAEKEEESSNSSAWLVIADWDVYINKVMKGIKSHSTKYHESLSQKIDLLNRCSTELSLPWKSSYFKELDKRKLIGGMDQYGWLGHVAASGDFRRMLKNGSPLEHKTIVDSINAIAKLSIPLDVKKLKVHLDNLVALGPTMKVWGRLLSIVRPDLFCTISAPRVRKAIANTLDKSEKYFQDVDGYLMLLSLIHSSPWFNSKAPTAKNELEIWKRRAAFLDVIFY